MQQIIDGKKYDTEKAELIGIYQYGFAQDFHYIIESLYVTKKSKVYFIAGEGGPNSKYRKSVGQNTWSGSEEIVPLTKEQAFEWAQDYLDTEDVECHFSDMIEDA